MGSELASEYRLSAPSESVSTRNMDEQGFSQEDLNPCKEGEDTAFPKLHATQERARLEGRLDANFQETLKVHEELKASFKRWENEMTEQRSLFVIQADKVTLLQKENQKFSELVARLQSQAGKFFELQESACESKTVIGKIRQEVNSLRSFRDEIMDSVLGVVVGQLYRDKRRLQEDLCKCQSQLYSAKQILYLKTLELALVREDLLELEEDNHKFEQKVEMMEEELCKERAGHVDSIAVVNRDSFDVYSVDHVNYFRRYLLDINSDDGEGLQTPLLLESKAKEMFDSIATLSRFISMYKNPGGVNPYLVSVVESDLWKRTPNTLDKNWTDCLKHFICLRLFDNFQSETFGRTQGEMLFLDPEERVTKCFEYFACCKKKGALQMAIYHSKKLDDFDLFFVEYLASKSFLLLPLELRPICEVFKTPAQLTAAQLHELLPGIDIDNRNLVESLILAVEKVWQFHKLCLSFEPPATLFRAATGSSFNQVYMERINSFKEDDRGSVHKVGFPVYPGFRLQKLIIKCKVFLAS